MSALAARLRRRVLAIPARETTFERRGFVAASPAVRRRMESIGTTFVWGYHAALEHGVTVARHLDTVAAERRGWAYEGAGMALALLDLLSPLRGDRVEAFLAGPAAAHTYMVHIGAGWALARLRRRGVRYAGRFNPLLRPLVYDGYGFHEGYFRWPRTVTGRQRPRRLAGYELNAFDQGLGRSLWFVCGAEASRILDAATAFETPRRGDLWSGVGLACAYAGGVDRATVEAVAAAAGRYRPQAAQGAAFAAEARRRAGNPAAHTDEACRILCGVPAGRAAAIAHESLAMLETLKTLDAVADAEQPAYEQWRRSLHDRFADADPAAHAHRECVP